MPKKKPTEAPGLSLFPFLSILACLSGALIVIIAALSALQANKVSGSVAKDNPLAKQYMTLQQQNQSLLELVEKVEQTKRYKRQLEVLEEQNVAVLNILNGNQEVKVVNASLQRAVENIIKQIEEIKLDQDVEKKEIERLKKEIEARKIDPETQRPINVKPSGSGVVGARRLYVLEASGGTLIAYQHEGPELRISQGSIGLDTRYNQYLTSAATNRNIGSDGLLLFLVRPDGHESWRKGAGWAESKFLLKTVKVPIPDKGIVDLAQFKKYMAPLEERFGADQDKKKK
jgi:hypothetical protein